MISKKFILLAFWLLMNIILNTVVNCQSSSNKRFHSKRRVKDYSKRQQSNGEQSIPSGVNVVEPVAGITLSEQIISQSNSNPVGASELVQQIPYIPNNSSGITETIYQLVQGDSNEAQLPWNSNVPFIQGASTTANQEGGWESLPQVEGFMLNRTWEVVPGAIMPFYSTSGIDPSQVKRAVITYPGQPRDAWLYADLYRNALEVIYSNQTYGVEDNSVLIISPFWGNQLDSQAGSLQQNELYFEGDGWMAGEESIGPSTLENSLSSFEIMDNFTDILFDKSNYPNLNQVVIAGHSMGGQASQKYALLKKQKSYDPNMSFWVANPGSWAYLSADRPYYNSSCNSTYNTWEYGLGGDLQNMTKYARYSVATDLNFVVDTYIKRNVHYALGLLDNGPGDTHCEALDQGGNHLDRGSQFAIHLYQVNNNSWPSSQTVDFIGNTSHQDYAMISSNTSIYWMFANNFNTRFPDIKPFNPTNGSSSSSSDQNGSQSTSSSSSKSGSSVNQANSLSVGGGYYNILFITCLFGLIPLTF